MKKFILSGNGRLGILTALLMTTGILQVCGQKNYVGIDPFLPLFGTFQPQYERAISPHFSAVIGVGYKSSSGLFEINGMQTESINLNDFGFNGFKILPEVRWYPGQTENGLWGFYTGVYYKYQSNKSNLTGTYRDNSGSDISVDLDLSLSSNTGGVEIGYKLRAYKGLFFDFIFAGLGVASHRVTVSENADLPDVFYQRFSEAAERYSILKDLEPRLNFTPQDLDTRVVLPNFRYGVKIGWAF
ncbi:MAG: hypothetical protein RLZZ630_1385 [Bacteroidota bacterium]|jgi:hypothetical protein